MPPTTTETVPIVADISTQIATKAAELGFEPEALKAKYKAERDKRLRPDGIDQYHSIQGGLNHFIEDPWVKPGFTRTPVKKQPVAIIIGGGYGGQLAAVRLIDAGIKDILMIEKAGDFGGTWYWNKYPGAMCDIESYIYMPLLEELNYMPKEKYTKAEELLQHSHAIGRKYDLYSKTLFQTEVKSLTWEEKSAAWIVKTSRDDDIRTRFVIPASGPLHRPKLPGIPGIELFKGHSFHSSRWDYNYTGGGPNGGLSSLKDKRVGIIGTGATAIQIVPQLGEWAKELFVFQRTPSSIDVRGNRPTDPAWASTLKPGWQKERMKNFTILVSGGRAETDMVADGWTDVFSNIAYLHAKEGIDPNASGELTQLADFIKMESIRTRVDDIVKDPETAAGLKPWYNQLCKRPCFHDQYLPTFNRPNVSLVDTNGKGIEAITEKGIRANGKEYELDCIVYATGFELTTDWSQRSGMEIYGRSGLSITEKWKEGVSTLYGLFSREFPNCFFISPVQAALTPNYIYLTDKQAGHIAYVVSRCIGENIDAIEPSAKAEADWVDLIVETAKFTEDFNKACTPGYFNNEGKVDPKAVRNGYYGGGALDFLQIFENWRAAGELDGMEVTKLKE